MMPDEAQQPERRSLAVFERIARDAVAAIGQRLFTVTAFDAAAMAVERVYSSNPATYPVGGSKPKRDTEFARRILIDGEPLVCKGDAEIARIFDDHATIRGLGLHASINAPVSAADGRVVGVLNFLLAADDVTQEQLRAACDFARDPAVIAALGG
jgi:hypothetical protein